MARTRSTETNEDGTTRNYTRRTPAERAQTELDKANARVEKAQKRVEKAQAETEAAAKELSRAERFREYAASSPDLPEQEAPEGSIAARVSELNNGEPEQENASV
jgi:multidrug efflux pump subunit AcrA (membrane-fusion protein)